MNRLIHERQRLMTIIAAPAASTTVVAIAAAETGAVTTVSATVALARLVSTKSTQSVARTGVSKALVGLGRRKTRLSTLTDRVGGRSRTTRLTQRRRTRSRWGLVAKWLQGILVRSLGSSLLLSVGLGLTGEHSLAASKDVGHGAKGTAAGSVLLCLGRLAGAGAVVAETATKSALAAMHRRGAKSANVGRRRRVRIVSRLGRHSVAVVRLAVHTLAERSTVALLAVGASVLVHVGTVVRAAVVRVVRVRECSVASLAVGLVHVLRLSCRMVLSSNRRSRGVLTAVLGVSIAVLSLLSRIRR